MIVLGGDPSRTERYMLEISGWPQCVRRDEVGRFRLGPYVTGEITLPDLALSASFQERWRFAAFGREEKEIECPPVVPPLEA